MKPLQLQVLSLKPRFTQKSRSCMHQILCLLLALVYSSYHLLTVLFPWEGIALRHCLKLACRTRRSSEPRVSSSSLQSVLGCFGFPGLFPLESTYCACSCQLCMNTSPLPAMPPPTLREHLSSGALANAFVPFPCYNCPTPRYPDKSTEKNSTSNTPEHSQGKMSHCW